MGYIEIVAIVFSVIWGLFALMLIHYAVFMLVGIFKRKTYPETDKKLRYGIIIGARNEAGVIGGLIDSINACDYPKDKIQVFVIAHNCTDKTAKIAREKGATVYEYNNPEERTVGYAYKYLVDRINEDYGWQNYDGFFIINADNVLTPDYLSKMNDAFVATDGKQVITSYRNSKNFGSNYISCLYGIFFISSCRYESRGRTVCGCSTRVSGTGYLFNSETIKNGWEYVTLTEDWEFTADRIADGAKIVYCDDAEFFDEQPTTLKIMLRQRFRWARGHMIVFFTRFKKLMGSLFRSKKKGGHDNKFSVYDISASILPLGVMGVTLGIVQLVFLALSPLFGENGAIIWTWFGILSAVGFGISYTSTFLVGLLLIIIEAKRIPKVRPIIMFVALLLWPFFLLLNVFLDVLALFKKKVEWKVIPHGDNSAQDNGGADDNVSSETECSAEDAQPETEAAETEAAV